ncbi:hypothetical protein [Enterobacter genomosp. O]|uniref:Uncharacterized protein n=1 Tax=Enterobacter genomosp. O TaxID=2364150 RepID=A0A0X4ESV5_9ENTR|nr:hypothetical protein [Enterobacter genomosp. O]KUQ84810.1 hypothetical protein AWI28_15085 [Enterobacter genomosp. O]
MTTPDKHLTSVERGESPSFMAFVGAELRTIARELTETKAFGKLGMMAVKSVPMVGPVIDTAKELAQGLIDRENSECQRRLQEYVLGVVQDEQYNDSVEFREQDVIPVIRKLAADDEAAKTEYYTRLTVALGRTPLNVMPADLRYHFIRLVSSLTCYQIAFARELKIRQTVPVWGTASFEESELVLTSQDNGMAMQAVRTLQNSGLMKEMTTLPRQKKPEGTLYKTTSDFNTLMELLFHPGDFEPETVGLRRKDVSDIIIVGTPVFIDNLYDTYLPTALKNAGLKAKVVASNDNHLTTDWAPLYLQTGIEGKDYNQSIKLFLTRGGTADWKNAGDNYLHCKFDKRTFNREKSTNAREAGQFRKEMDRIVTSILTQMKNIKSSS